MEQNQTVSADHIRNAQTGLDLLSAASCDYSSVIIVRLCNQRQKEASLSPYCSYTAVCLLPAEDPAHQQVATLVFTHTKLPVFVLAGAFPVWALRLNFHARSFVSPRF